MSKQKRYKPVKNHRGIRKDTVTGKFLARKCIGKKQYTKTFVSIADAISWEKYFHPLLTDTEVRRGSVRKTHLEISTRVQARSNGVDQRFTFEDVWEFYKKQHFPNLEPQSVEARFKIAKSFFPELKPFKMVEITPEVLDSFMEKKVDEAKTVGNPKRRNFDNDLKFLKAFFNWYRENYDGMFVVPIRKRHFVSGILTKTTKNLEKMSLEHFLSFLDAFDDSFWRDFAKIHFFMAGRVQEVAGLQWSSIDFHREILSVRDVAIWGDKKKFTRLKEIPKNREARVVHLNGQMLSILNNQWKNKSESPCGFFRESTGERLDFVFHKDGQPLSYRSIQYRYNKALKKAGLFPRFSATHILRKAMANVVRQELGLDAAQAAGGWKTRRVVEQTYTDAPNLLNKKAVNHVEKLVIEGECSAGLGSERPNLKLV